MDRHVRKAVILAAFVTFSAQAQQTIELRVTATVPPRPCEYPNRCEPVLITTQSKVVVEQGKVTYRGSRPAVSTKDGLMTIRF